MTTFKTICAVAGLSLVAACTTITPYGPAPRPGAAGYVDARLEQGKYRIAFEGNSSTDRATIENYVLYRAAELTIRDGYDYFIVVDQTADAERTFTTNGTAFGGGGFGRPGFFYGGAFGGFGQTNAVTRERQRFIIGAIIESRRGDKPADNPRAYDARQVIDNLGPMILPPAPAS
ncbi:MAG: hypothetical protein AAF850_03555 [Pseudomonadota bacterium]